MVNSLLGCGHCTPASGARPWNLPFPDRVLLTTMYLRTNLTERQLSVLFGVSQKQVDRVLHDLMTPLGDPLALRLLISVNSGPAPAH